MFNALNRFISRLDGEPVPAAKENHGAFGFQVLRNNNLQLAIEPWFDFVVGINGRMIDDSDPALFAQEVRNCAGSSVMLGLWSAKGQRTRALHIPVPADTASLGLTLQWTPISVVSNIWHVLDVPANSPADAAGLLPYSDYILGTPEGVLHGEGGLSELVEDHIGRPLRLYVYNNEYNVTPSADFLVPAQMVDAQAAPVSAPPRSKKKERPQHGAPNLMDDYFKEQEKKSRELDNAPSGRNSPLPPPPKGGPPRGGPPRAGSTPPKEQEAE
ncbi:hypothetical protein NEMBOFW57_002566 [Staphylotrichum longicolle]|uniref:PDZ GRASP-type domain-containing protein n=1 Tax=Staphylotrichum longicolle TaxID=669026 RepID=A0AAD4I2L2_9PEZI|nr:hypothetical protein NEMBOFW57_002566 [Staphylotrichum longicolle]